MADCSNCPRRETPPPVPYIVHEAELARAERTNKRLRIALIVQTVLIGCALVARVFGI